MFNNQTILVTGASMGIGESVARELARRGADLILAARSEELLKQISESLPCPHPARYFRCDFSDPAAVAALGEKILATGKLDGIVHNAGVGMYGEFGKLSDVEVRRLFEINFFSILSLTRSLLPLLQKSPRARILTVSSVIGWRAIPRLSAYCASKGAINLFVEALRVELAAHGISLTNAYPGRTATGFSQNAMSVGWKPFSTEGGGTPPDKVARRLVRAFHKGKRDEFVSFSNRALIWLNFFFPWFIDWGLGRYFRNR